MDWQSATQSLLGQCLDTYSEVTTYHPIVGSPFSLRAIFDNVYQTQDPETGAVVLSTNPKIGVRFSDLPSPPANGDKVTVRSISYLIVGAQPDGQGGAELILSKA